MSGLILKIKRRISEYEAKYNRLPDTILLSLSGWRRVLTEVRGTAIGSELLSTNKILGLEIMVTDSVKEFKVGILL